MHKYSQDELKPATEVARGFGSILKEISSDSKKRIIVVKNNKLEAAIISLKEYEKLKDSYDILEQLYKKGMISGDKES